MFTHKTRNQIPHHNQTLFLKLDVTNVTMLSAPSILSNEVLKRLKLKRHRELMHEENMDSVKMFRAKRAHYDRRKMPPAFSFCLTSQSLVCTSHEVSLKIEKAPHTAGEELINSSVIIVHLLLLG